MKETPINTGTDMSSIVSDPAEKDIIRKSQAREEAVNEKIEGKVKDIESLKVPEMPKMPDAPKQGDYITDPMKTFGSGAMWLATFGSLLTRHPLTTALNAASDVNKAVANNDANAYKNAMDKWKLHSDYALKLANYDMDRYREALGKDDAAIRAYSGMMKNDTARLALDIKQNDQHLKDTERQLKMMEEGFKLQNLEFQKKYADLSVNAARDQAQKEGRSFSESDATRIYNESLGTAKAEQSGKVSKDVEAARMAQVNWDALKDDDQVGDSGLTFGAVKQAAQTIATTGDYSKAGLGIGWNAAKMAVDNYLGHAYPNLNRAAVGLDYAAQKKATTEAARNYANMTIATNNLDYSIPLLKEKIEAVHPGKFKSSNELANWLEEHAGEPEIIGLKEAVMATQSDYSQVIARGGQVTDSVRAEAQDKLNKAWNTGQFIEALDTMKKEGQNQLKAAKSSLKEAKKAGLLDDEDKVDKSEEDIIHGDSAIAPLPNPEDKKYVPGKYYDLTSEGYGVHKYLGNGEFE